MTAARLPEPKITTIERFILDQQQQHVDATGTLTGILYDMALAAKIIAGKTTRAGLAEILGSTGEENVQGEVVQKLDHYAQRTIFRLNDHTGRLAVMASEEEAEIIPIPAHFPVGKYVLLYDPLDGSSNIDYNISIGTIFAIYRRRSESGPGTLADVLQPGRDLVAAGYIIYGSGTVMVLASPAGVHGFTLDPTVGEFFLSHENIQVPERGNTYSINEGNYHKWSPRVREWADWIKSPQDGRPAYGHRYIGAMVADLHRTLLRGGIFVYPADKKNENGKLRLLYEASPMAFIVEAAGGAAHTGTERVLDVIPTELHQRTPLYIGSRLDVEDALRIAHD